ncbi:MAG: SDR family oxidoreductase [Halobacteriota archaeon]
MRVLVTGGAGFIGGHLAEALVEGGHQVTALDNLDPFYDVRIKERNVEIARSVAADADGRYTFVEGDVRDRELVEEVVSAADVVFHEAAQAGVRASLEEPHKPTTVNVTGTLNVLDAARGAGVDRVILASSSSVYGRTEYLPYDEAHPTRPVSPYGVSKLAGEHYGRVYHETFGLPVVSLRYFTVYGPRMRPNMAISNFVSRCMNGESPVVYGDGTQTRDFTHVDDVVAVNRTLLEADAADGTVLNVGSGGNITVLELAEHVRDAIDPDLPIAFDDRPPGDAEHTHADVSRARRLLGYEPSVDIRDGVADFIEWYAANRDWYDPLVRAS